MTSAQRAGILILAAMLTLIQPIAAFAASPSGISVLVSDVRPDFPRKIDFHAAAQSTGQVTSARLAFRIADQTVTHIGRAAIQPDNRVDVHYVLDLQREYLPPGLDLHYQWMFEDQTGATASTNWSDLTLADPRFQWQQRTASGIQLEWYDVDDAYANAVLDAATAAYTSAGQLGPAASKNPVRVLLYGNINEFRGALGVGSQAWVGGQTFPQDRIILLLVSPTDLANAQRSVAHEITHLRIDGTSAGIVAPLPTWLDEGLAMVAEGNTQPVFSQALDQAVRDRRLFSLQSLSGNFPESPDDATIAYAESESLVRFYLKTYGTDKLVALVDAFRAGLSADDAFRQSVGVSARDFQTTWQASLGTAPVSATPASSSSPIVRGATSPLRAIVALIDSLIRSLESPKLKTT